MSAWRRRLRVVVIGIALLAGLGGVLWWLFETSRPRATSESVVWLHNGSSQCAATLLDDQRALVTAGHCIVNQQMLAQNDTIPDSTVLCAVDPLYSKSVPPYHDLAVCAFTTQVKGVKGAKLTGLVNLQGVKVAYYGYGTPASFLRMMTGTPPLREGKGTVTGTANATLSIDGSKIWEGDSGGPVMPDAADQSTLVGVLSCYEGVHEPRAVNLGDSSNREWLDWCLKELDKCTKPKAEPFRQRYTSGLCG